MLIKSDNFSRRRLLRGSLQGAAVAVALPYLDIFLNDSGTAFAATGQALPTRFGTWFWGLGVDPVPFTPKTIGAMAELPPQLAPLAKVKDYLNVFTNYNVLTDGRPNLCHYTGWVALRTGSAPGGRGLLPGQSLDVAIADVIGGGSRFRMLNMAATGVPRDSYSFRSGDAVNPPEISAVELYQKLFGVEFQDPNSPNFTPDPRLMVRKSVLSGVGEQRADFEKGLGAADKARLDQYYTSVRELESRLELQLQKPPAAPDCKLPTAAPKEVPVGLDVELVSARHRAMTDLLAMALICNQTKVFNMVYSDSGSSLARKGVDKTHHIVTHEEPVDPVLGYQPTASKFVGEAMKEWGYFVEKLATSQEGAGSLLDNTLVYAHTDCQIAKVHSIDGIPMMTAGRAGGRIKSGLHIDGKGQAGTRLGLTLQRAYGLPVASWGTQSMEASQEIGDILT
ncbi:MAG: hypothetical protein JWQ11_2861 [Rhizobacter sp.]|nr:hypothetical protein [Rhizobacter sp.]